MNSLEVLGISLMCLVIVDAISGCVEYEISRTESVILLKFPRVPQQNLEQSTSVN